MTNKRELMIKSLEYVIELLKQPDIESNLPMQSAVKTEEEIKFDEEQLNT